MKPILLMLTVLSLTACASATRMHTVCEVPRFTWANLGQPPANSDALKVVGNAGQAQPSESETWFSDKNGRLMLCRVDLQHQCGSLQLWTFDLADGQWTVEPQSGPVFCIAE